MELTWARLPIVLALLLLAPAAAADPKDVHQQGEQALAEKRWQDAVRFFSAAVAERSEEKVPLLGRRYLPHYFLGVALAELGDCTGALDAWAETERQGKIGRAEDLAATLPKRKEACRERLRQVELAESEVADLLRQADATTPTLASLAERQALVSVWSGGPGSYAARVAEARQRLAEARRRLTEGSDRGDLGILADAEELASGALAELRAVIGDARRQLGELNAAAESALEELAAVESAALEAVRSVSDLQPYPPGLAGRVAEVQLSLQRIEERRDAALAPELEALGSRLQEAVEELGKAAARPSQTLWNAAEAFLGGRYQEVLDQLAGNPYTRGRTAYHACHLEAASRFALYVVGGESQPELLEQARQGVLDCHERAPYFKISRKFFSPRYVELYDATVNAAANDQPSAESDESP